MGREQSVVEFYVLCNRLKNVIRTGWKTWNVSRDRLESVAEHVYGVQMLAISMWSEYKYDVDMQKAINLTSNKNKGMGGIDTKGLARKIY